MKGDGLKTYWVGQQGDYDGWRLCKRKGESFEVVAKIGDKTLAQLIAKLLEEHVNLDT